MIILPDRNICRTKFLKPVSKKEWMPSSQAIPKDSFGKDGIVTKFRVRAKLNDGYVKWIGWFDDRDDFDIFLWSLLKGTLKYEKNLWKLPTPEWSNDIGEQLTYDFLTITYLTSPTGSNQTYNTPSDWPGTSLSNTIYVFGGGGGGGRNGTSGVQGSGGAGGGAASGVSLVNLPATVTYQIGSAGVGGTTAGQDGTNGGDTWFNGTTFAGATVAAKGGLGSTAGTGVAGGAAASGIGEARYSGGTGGNGQTSNGAGGGGGGAAGPDGNGGNGTNGASGNGGNGGAGNAGLNGGGAGATADGGTGGNGTNLGSTYGSGGGGGGGGSATNTGGNGGSYGAGGGGGRTTSSGSSSGGNGREGMIYIQYEPLVYVGGWNNSPMLGM